MRWQPVFALIAAMLAAASGSAAAQEPGPLATPTERLDHLLSTWRGQTAAHLREVWGREQESQIRGSSLILVYEKRVKVRAGLGGITIHPDGGLRCVVRFEINEADEVARVARLGGGQDCWNQWRRLEL